jgi:hypothetical protein
LLSGRKDQRQLKGIAERRTYSAIMIMATG